MFSLPIETVFEVINQETDKFEAKKGIKMNMTHIGSRIFVYCSYTLFVVHLLFCKCKRFIHNIEAIDNKNDDNDRHSVSF